MPIDDDRCAILLLLDLSAALCQDFLALGLRERCMHGSDPISVTESNQWALRMWHSSHPLTCGVPQGSVLRPIIYLIYTSPSRQYSASSCYLISFVWQYELNATARVIALSRKADHIMHLLMDLHWLPVEQCIDFTILLFTFKIVNGLARSYLNDLLVPYVPKRALRSIQHIA